MKTFSHSSFWLGEKTFNRMGGRQLDTMELVKYQRSISKFVRILTKESIPVEFRAEGGDSYTNGEHIVISSDIKQSNFDSIVGLALHEGSHIKLTDFKLLPNYSKVIERIVRKNFKGSDFEMNDLINELNQKMPLIKSLLNYVEDRRIDYYVYTNSPGYKPYYEAMYDRYFNDPIIDKAIQSNDYRDVSFQSYMFRIINFLNKKTDLDALPRLEEIYNLIFSNVSSIKDTTEALEITYKIYMIIKEEIDKLPEEETDDSSESDNDDESNDDDESTEAEAGSGSSNSSEPNSDSNSDSEGGSNNGDTDEGEQSDNGSTQSSDGSDESDNQSNQSNQSNGNKTSSSSSSDLTDREKSNVEKQLEKQRKFLDGEVDKKAIEQSTKSLVDALSKMDIKDETVSYDKNGYVQQMDVTLIKGFNDEALEIFPRLTRDSYDDTVESRHENVMKGIRLGRRLGNKLRIRNRDRTTTYNRRKKGKLDKRRIHALGQNTYNVFNEYVTEKHEDAFLHISIDGSGSMDGEKLNNSILSAVAIAQMADMTNIDVQISMRYTNSIGGGSNRPIVWIVYDSRKDSMKTITKYFKHIKAMGMTPEGLCFDRIMDELPKGTDSLKTYFINYSDGAPNFRGYGGETAVTHTKKQVDKLRKNGYSILSFFIESGRVSYEDEFKEMYGRDATTIDPTELSSLASTLQKMFT